jgi:hypothetical protein
MRHAFEIEFEILPRTLGIVPTQYFKKSTITRCSRIGRYNPETRVILGPCPP